MEVHAHSHTARKKWTHYFWEFLMLFLAVFCGFLAENQREHYIEHQRTKEYAQQMIDDLKRDTSVLNYFIEDVDTHFKNFDTVNALFGQTPPVSNKILLQAVLRQRGTYPIQLSATTFNQMKSSGNIRYFKNSTLSGRISGYYERDHSFLNTAFNYTNNFFTTDLQPFMLDHFDYNESDYFTDTLKVEKPVYYKRSYETDLHLRNRLILYNSLLKYTKEYPVKHVQNSAVKLIELLTKEYHLK